MKACPLRRYVPPVIKVYPVHICSMLVAASAERAAPEKEMESRRYGGSFESRHSVWYEP